MECFVFEFLSLHDERPVLRLLTCQDYLALRSKPNQAQWQGLLPNGEDAGYRMPEYDIDVVPERNTSYTKISQNELALQLYTAQFFNPQNADQALACLSIMDFDSKEEVEQKVAQNGTLFTMLRQWQQLALELAARFAPEMVPGLSQQITGDAGIVPVGGSIDGIQINAGELKGESTRMKNAREHADAVSRPGGSAK